MAKKISELFKVDDRNKKYWFDVSGSEDNSDGWEPRKKIFEEANKIGITVSSYSAQGFCFTGVNCREEQVIALIEALGEEEYDYYKLDKATAYFFKRNVNVKDELTKKISDIIPKKEDIIKPRKESLDDQLMSAIEEYNLAYSVLNDHGIKLFNQRERSIDLLENVEKLVNSIANHNKSFDKDIHEINLVKVDFTEVCDFAKEELSAAQGSAVGVGAGVAGGTAVASLAPSAAMWVATTFGTASTGTAISTLSGAAARSAALAWLGGGAITAGGQGVIAGQALLALSGPIGWGITGATILSSVVLFTNKKVKLNKEKKEEIESILKNAENVKEVNLAVAQLFKKTKELRLELSNQYTECMSFYGQDFMKLSDEEQMKMGALVNNALALSYSLKEGV